MSYWLEKTEIFIDNNENEINQKNYDRLMDSLHGNKFGEFLADIGLTRNNAMRFLINALTYVNDENNDFST